MTCAPFLQTLGQAGLLITKCGTGELYGSYVIRGCTLAEEVGEWDLFTPSRSATTSKQTPPRQSGLFEGGQRRFEVAALRSASQPLAHYFVPTAAPELTYL